MLSSIVGMLAGPLVDRLIAPLTHVFDQFINKQITEAQLREKLQEVLVTSFKEIEVAHADVLAKTYQTFWTAATEDKTNIMKIMWAAATGSQIWVLFWAQWVVPLLYAYGFMDKGWHAGGTTEWAYALLAGLLGMGPVVFRTGPGSGTGVVDSLKRLVGK